MDEAEQPQSYEPVSGMSSTGGWSLPSTVIDFISAGSSSRKLRAITSHREVCSTYGYSNPR